MPTAKAEPNTEYQCRALLLAMGAGETDGGRRGWWGQARPMGAVSHRPHARTRPHRTLGKPPGQIPSQQEAQLSIDPTRRKTIDLYTKEREGKLNTDCQSRSPMPSASAELSSSARGQARQMGAGEADGGRRDWWGQVRSMGAASHRPDARVHQHRGLRKPPGQIPSQHPSGYLPKLIMYCRATS